MLTEGKAVDCFRNKSGNMETIKHKLMYFSGANTAKGGKDDELLTTMVCCSVLGIFSLIQRVM